MTAAGAYAALQASEVRDQVREALDRREPLRIAGRGEWMDAGRPVRATRQLAVGALSGIIDYVPGDLTLTALAGTPLAEIAAATRAEGQWLAIDPPGSADGSLGATVATASAGALSHGLGVPRDVVLGLEVVTGAGALVRTGGRVVKNVAGFDLSRLFTGSWGTLCVITEVTVRLRALPEVDETVALVLDDRRDALVQQLAAVRTASMAPMALELVSAHLASALDVGDATCLLARFGGNALDVRAQRETLGRLGVLSDVDAGVWERLRLCEPRRARVIRLSRAPSRIAETWSAARSLAAGRSGALQHATVGRGIVRCVLPDDGDDPCADLLAEARRFDGQCIFERLPARCWDAATGGGGLSSRIPRSVKESFDPMHILNPGILGDGS